MAILALENLNTYKTRLGDLDGKGASADIKIGGESQESFLPNINIFKWDNECWLNINHRDVVSIQKETLVEGLVEIDIGNNKHRYYVTPAGTLEYEIEFAEKPLSNVVELDLSFSEGLNLYYQPALTAEEIAEGCIRPENVVGSYAIYWKKRNNQYKTGKFCHIFRPKIIDAEGKWVWCDLEYRNKKLKITIPQTFLNSAIYPIILDPELGYSTAGSSNAGNSTVVQTSHDVTDASGGGIDTYHCAIAAVSASNNYKMGVYDTNQATGEPDNRTLIEEVEFTAVTVSDDNSIAGGSSNLSASTRYSIAKIEENTDTKTKYDTGDAGDHWSNGGKTYAGQFDNPSDESAEWNSGDRLWSIWVDYSPAWLGPVYEDNGGIATGVDYSVDVPYPAIVNENDILLVCLLDADDDSFDTPSGWAKIDELIAEPNASFAWYWKRATGSETGTETFTSALNAGSLVAGVMARYSNCVTSGTPYDTTGGPTRNGVTQSTIINLGSVTTQDDNRLVVAMIGVEDNLGISQAANYVEDFEVTTDVGGDGSFSFQSQEVASAGVVSAETATTGNDYWGTLVLALIPPGPVGYTLIADSGSYGLTGQAVGLLANRKVSAASGSYAITGIAAGLLRGYPLAADAGSFNISGQDVGLIKASKIPTDSGSYAITGQDAGLLKGSRIAMGSGGFDITGQDVALLRGLKIGVESGAYSLTGQDVTLTYTPVGAYILTAESGTYNLTGIAVDLLRGSRIGIEAGSFLLSGQDASLIKSFLLALDSGSYGLTGQDVTLTYTPISGYTLIAESGTYGLTGNPVDLLRNYLVSAESGSYNLSGQAASLLKSFILGIEAGGYNLTGSDVALLRNALLSAQTGLFILTGQDADLIYSGTIIKREILELSSVINQILSKNSIINVELSAESFINQSLPITSIVELEEE